MMPLLLFLDMGSAGWMCLVLIPGIKLRYYRHVYLFRAHRFTYCASAGS